MCAVPDREIIFPSVASVLSVVNSSGEAHGWHPRLYGGALAYARAGQGRLPPTVSRVRGDRRAAEPEAQLGQPPESPDPFLRGRNGRTIIHKLPIAKAVTT